MSLRYCWERYTKNVKYTQNTRSVRQALMDVDSAQEIMVATGYTFDNTTGLYTLKSPSTNDVLYDATSKGTAYINAMYCFCPNGTSNDTTLLGYSDESCVFKFTKVTSGFRVECRFSTSDPAIVYFTERYRGISTTKGDKIDDIIGTAQSQYPANGVSGSYWYVYQGSDSIDPVAVNLSQSIGLYVGLPITISVDPSTSKVYGGTVSYQYQVQINNDGQWITLGTTTETSYPYTIPIGATNLQFRVLASDDLGFTSTDYVNSASVSVVAFKPGTQQVLHRKNASGGYDVIWLETDSEVVIRPDGTTLEATLADIESRLSGLGV